MDRNEQNSTKTAPPKVNPQTGLTATQELCASLLAAGEKVSAVAERLQISRTTIYQWGDLLTFQCFSNQLRDEIKRNINESLTGMAAEAVEAIRQVLSSDNEGMKLKAATWILERMDSTPIGECNPFKALKEKATYDEVHKWDTRVFHPLEYDESLEELGLKDTEQRMAKRKRF